MKTNLKSKHLIFSLFNLIDIERLVFLFVIFTSLNCFSQNYSIIGNGTASNTSNSYPAPYGLYFFGAKHQFLITSAELTAAGVPAGASISSIGFNVVSDNGTAIHNGFEVVVYSTTNADPLQLGYNTTGQVSSSSSTNFNPSTGWNQHALSSFTWNGTTNLVIQTCFNNSSYSTNASTQWTTTLSGTNIKSRYFYQDASTACSSTTLSSPSSTTRPNILIGWTAALSNDLVCNATLISCGETLSGSTINSTLSGTGEGINCGISQIMPGVWYSISGNGQTITASLCGTSWDSKISVFSGSDCSSLYCVGGIDDYGPSCSSNSASYSWNSVSGIKYYILVHGYNSNSAFSISLSCAVNAPSNPTGISISETSGNSTNDGSICSGDTAQLSVSGSSGTTYWFLDSCGSSISSSIFNGIVMNVSPTSTTTYYASNYSGGVWGSSCVSYTIIVNPLPSAPSDPSSNSPECNTVTILRSGTPPTGMNWYWQGTNANGTSTTLGSGANYSVSSSGTYYIRAMNSFGCWSASSGGVVTTVFGSPQAPTIPSSNSPNCGSVNINRNGTPPAGTSWYWQGTNANGTSTTLGSGINYTANSSGTYYIRAYTSNNCWSNLSTGLPIIVLSSLSATQNQVVCDSYVAPDGLNYTNSGQYQAIISNSAGCDSIITINLTVNNSYSVQNTVLACQSFTWIDGNAYTEDNNTATYLLTSSAGCDSLVTLDLDISLPSNDTTYIQSTALGSFELNGVVYFEDGIYYQTLPDQYGCDSTIAIELSFDQSNLLEYNDLFLLVYPNPSRDGIFQLKIDKPFYILGVTDSYGRDVRFFEENEKINLSHLEKGYYFVHVETGNSVVTIKLIFF